MGHCVAADQKSESQNQILRSLEFFSGFSPLLDCPMLIVRKESAILRRGPATVQMDRGKCGAWGYVRPISWYYQKQNLSLQKAFYFLVPYYIFVASTGFVQSIRRLLWTEKRSDRSPTEWALGGPPVFGAAPATPGGHLDYAGIRDKMTYISEFQVLLLPPARRSLCGASGCLTVECYQSV